MNHELSDKNGFNPLFFKQSKCLDDYLKLMEITPSEGWSQQYNKQILDILDVVENHKIESILEIGFNCGHGTELFLSYKDNTSVTSFSIVRGNLKFGKAYINAKYPNRFTQILGPSQDTIPKYTENNPNKKFDLIFIDGAHWEPIPYQDLHNCRLLAHENTIIIFDDVIYSSHNMKNWNMYPTKVWKDAIQSNYVTELGHNDYDIGRGQSWGKYVF
jgi:predicted O-methyltransferase YrrM